MNGSNREPKAELEPCLGGPSAPLGKTTVDVFLSCPS